MWTKQDFEEMRKDWSNNTLVGWKLVYHDGTEITSKQMRFDDAPQYGIMFLVKYYKRKKGGYSREIQNGLDFYVLYSDVAESLTIPPQVKLGKNVPMAQFKKMLQKERDCKCEAITEMI